MMLYSTLSLHPIGCLVTSTGISLGTQCHGGQAEHAVTEQGDTRGQACALEVRVPESSKAMAHLPTPSGARQSQSLGHTTVTGTLINLIL